MCRKVLGVWLVLFFLHSDAVSAAQYAFQITFTDKNNTPYSFSSPLTYLSPRALARRTTQSIALDSTDLPVNPAYLDSVIALTGGKIHGSSRWLNLCVVLLNDSSQILNLSGKGYISNIKLVGYFSPDLHRNSATNILPEPAKRTSDATYYGMTWTQTHIVNGEYLHDRGYKGQGKLIAVMDAGFLGTNVTHGFDSLYISGRLVDTFNFNNNTRNVYVSDAHGTEVLSNLAGYVPGTYVGSAPLATYALYVTDYAPGDQPMEMDNMLFASERADSIGADVISESLGYDLFDYPAGSGQLFSELDGKTTIAARAANMATKKGMLFVATAGNDGAPPIPGWGTHILTPGDADSALTIGAVDGSGVIAGFSGHGPNAAGQVKPDVCGMGSGAYSFNASGYNTPSGTSISTPQMAGFAACLWQANPTSKPFQLRQAIIKCASSYGNPGEQLGYGVPNFQCTNEILEVLDTPPPFTSANWVIVHPNPVGEELIISVLPDAEQYVDFSLLDMTGRAYANFSYYLYKGKNADIKIAIPGLVPGLYLLRASSQTQKQVIKLRKL